MAASKLELKDLKFVRQELHGVKEKWLDIGMELGASPTDLRKLAETHKQDYSICLNLMLMQWLESGDASWKILCEALKSSMVDEPSLSTQLQEKHCSEKSTSKSAKRARPDDGTAPKAKRPKASPLPTSFPPEDFLRFQPPNRICCECNKIPRMPLRPECCNTKLYCEPCSLKVKICSTHQAENKFKRDDEHYTTVTKLRIKCPNWKEGCDFKESVSKVYGHHLPHCTKAKPGEENTDTPKATDDPVSNDPGGTTKKTKKPGSKSADGRKSSSEGVVEEEVWYMASEEPQSHKTTTATATASPIVIPSNAVSSSLPTKTPKPGVPAVAIGGQSLPSTSQQQAPKLQSANVVQNLVQQSQKPGDPAVVVAVQQQQQQAQCPVERVATQVVYDVKQLTSMIQQLPATQMVYCLHKASGCTWKGVATQLIQHLTVCQYNQKSSRPHNITILSSEQTGSPHSPITPTTPLTTPITLVNSNPPSPMMVNRLKSSQSGSVPGSPVATQPPVPPRSPREKPKCTSQATLKEVFSTESLATSQVEQQAHEPPSKQVYDQRVSKEMHVVTSKTPQKVQQQQPTQSVASSLGQQLSSVSAQAQVASKTATEYATITSSTSAQMSSYSANVTTGQHAMTSKLSQTPVKSSTTVKSTSNSEVTQSKRNTSMADTVTAQPKVAKQTANTLTAAALTRSPLRHQKASSTINSTVSQALAKQPPNSQSSVLASSRECASFGQVRNGHQSASNVAVGAKPCKASTSQPLLQQNRPIMSPTVAQNQLPVSKSSIPNTSVSNIQQNAANLQAANALASQASPLQQIPVMVGLEYPPTLQQLQTLAMMGVQVPMYNLPLIVQNSNQQSVAGGLSVSNSAVCSQAVPIQNATKQPETANTGGGTVATKGVAQSKPRSQQKNITGASSSVHISPNVAASGAKGTNATTQKSNQKPTVSVASSNNVSTPALGVTMAQTTPTKPHTSTEHTKLTASASEKSITVAQKTQAKSHMPAGCTKLATCTSEKSVTVAQKTPPKLHTSVEHTKSSLPTTSSSSQAQEVTYLFTNTNSALTTAPPSSVHTKSVPASSSDTGSPIQKAVNATNTTPTSSKAVVLTKSGGRTASKRAAHPMHCSSTPTTSASTNSLQTVASSPISTTKHAPQVSLSAKKSLNFSGSATTNSNSSHGGLQTTTASSRVPSSPLISLLKRATPGPKLSAKAENSSSTVSVSYNRQKPQVNDHLQSLLCTVCQLTPRNPLRSQCCGALYCKPCSRRVDRCPQHKSSQLRFTRDVELFNVIQKQETKCKYAGNGCTWRGRVADRKQHISVCLYNPSRVQLEGAVKKEEKEFVPPPKTLGESGSGMACEYESIGCTERVPCGKMKLHLQEAIEQHLDLAIQRILLNETKLQ